MKVTGPGQPPAPGASGPETGNRSDKIDKAAIPGGPSESGKAFAEKVTGPRATGTAAAARGPIRPGDVAVNDLVADLRAGKLTSRAAIDQVLERVVARQVGPEAPPAVRDQIRAALQEAVQSDPLLAEKLRHLD